jgi:DNA-binding SARP family transcriptional activator
VRRLDGQRLAAHELAADLDLRLGRHTRLVERLPDLVAENPLRETLRGQLMVALYRSGRQVEALSLYEEARAVLAAELGFDPGPRLKLLH